MFYPKYPLKSDYGWWTENVATELVCRYHSQGGTEYSELNDKEMQSDAQLVLDEMGEKIHLLHREAFKLMSKAAEQRFKERQEKGSRVNIIIAVDFDGTCVTHEYPNIGKDIGAAPVLRKFVDRGDRLILYTMRSDKTLDQALKWFEENEIEVYGVNSNPQQRNWTNSPKAYANLYIDDAAFGCPLKFDEKISERPFVDWEVVEKLLLP